MLDYKKLKVGDKIVRGPSKLSKSLLEGIGKTFTIIEIKNTDNGILVKLDTNDNFWASEYDTLRDCSMVFTVKDLYNLCRH